ncbi:hypothetical protein RCG23_14450 [Neobacillus sp. PS3-34]|uniref:hypothetical protein n=1 Tax=Neobacillus sp. PS3-34 TaxID=3070678 RepID=UPI0027E1480C|nr:hypothetical protein [Neobacillus sp. PS3-34]WML46837.1 hypothetical protein RCG23_14450 [Neobacillus sp. PS3-34]
MNVIDLHDSRYPGYSVIGLLGNTGTFSIYNKETNQLLIQKLPLPAQEVPIYNIEKGADGSIYSSGFVSGQMTVLNPVTNETTVLKNVGQAEGMASLNGKMYFGIYPGAHLFEYDPTRKETLPRELFAVGNGQERPVAMVGVPGVNKLYIGTYPKSGEYGGALVTYDVKSGAKTVRRNLVPNQSIISLANFNGYVYGGTSIFSGKDLAGKRSALFFRMKAGNPNAKIEALPLAIKFPRMIHALAVGNDKRIWA